MRYSRASRRFALPLLLGALLCGSAAADVLALDASTLPAPRRPLRWSETIRRAGGRWEEGRPWVVAERGVRTGLYPDNLVVLTSPSLAQSFPARLADCQAGAYSWQDGEWRSDDGKFTPESLPEGSWSSLRAMLGEREFSLVVEPPRVAPGLPDVARERARFPHYYRLLVAAGGSLDKHGVGVLGLRGVGPDGTRHPSSDNQGGYDDTYVVLRRNRDGSGSAREFLGSTHAGRADDPDAPAAGVAQLKPGHYLARPIEHHHGMPCWWVRNPNGSDGLPARRDADADGTISEEEARVPARATEILFHNGVYSDVAASIGCLTMAPDVYPEFSRAVGRRGFAFTLLDANQQLPQSPVVYRLGRSVKGKPLYLREWGSGSRVALLFATIHGDEPVGTGLLNRLEREFRIHPELLEGWQVRLIVCANPDSRGRRRSNARGVDLNRNFAAGWRRGGGGGESGGPRPLSEPETRALRAAVLGLDPAPPGRPERILSIHQHGDLAAGEGWLDGDGPADSLARSLSEASGGRYGVHDIPDSQGRQVIPGSFGTWVSSAELAIPTITWELPRGERDPEEVWRENREVLLRFLQD